MMATRGNSVVDWEAAREPKSIPLRPRAAWPEMHSAVVDVVGGDDKRQPRRKTMGGAVGGEAAAPGEFVRLAEAIDQCVTFNPRQWRGVLDKSVAVLQRSGGTRGVRGTAKRVVGTDTRTTRSTQRASRSTLRPSSRDEDAPLKPARSASIGAFPPLSVSQYLGQPGMVESILKEQEEGDEQDAPSVRNAHPEDPHASPGLGLPVERLESDASCTNSEAEGIPMTSYGERVPDGTDGMCEKATHAVVLPLLTTVSPRTRRGIARLPVPSEAEMREIQSIERLADHPERFRDFYRELKRKQMQQARRQRMKMAVPVKKPMLQSLPKPPVMPLSPPKASNCRNGFQINKVGKNTEPLLVPQEKANPMTPEEIEQKCMEAEDPYSNDGVGPPTAVGRRNNRHTDSYNQLMREQQLALLDERVAESQVQHTIEEIRHWMPLDVIYAFGLGKFASPAQERASEMLFRVGIRLKNKLIVQGMRQWKDWVLEEQQHEQERAGLSVQCWWRQICAAREVAMRRRIYKELQRRQEAFLMMLASKQQQAACTITRSIRRYVRDHMQERIAAQLSAAIRIQRFWRRSCALWAALRRQMAKKKRREAAVCIQKHVRRLNAQKKRRLLEKIDHVEKSRQRRAVKLAARKEAMRSLGAVITIQRAVRDWEKRRVMVLRRRRAAFEKDKRKVVKVQAHYRGQKARKWVGRHKPAFTKAVLVLQCSWRCYQARVELQRRKKQASHQRDQWQKEIEVRRRSRQASILVPTQLKQKWGQLTLPKTGNASRQNEVAKQKPREVQAARKLQARWRGKQLRQRLRYEKAKEAERSRRAVNKKRRLAAVCIQKRVRGIQGRAQVWKWVEENSARRIQRVWRGFKTRRELLRMRNTLRVIKNIQSQWRTRQQAENQRFRAHRAAIIQRAARKFIGRRWLYAAVRRRQFLAEEHEMGKVLLERTRRRTKDELLLQSFVFKTLKLAEEKKQSRQQSRDKEESEKEDESTRVDQALYTVELSKRVWKRKGYDGVWQEVFRNASGNAMEMDNSHFARFLKALPNAFIHKTNFPMQGADLIFTKVKEPKAKTISFLRFNKAILMLLKEKFTASSGSKDDPKTDSGTDHERFLLFMNKFVLPSTIQNGKYRKMLETQCTERLLWAVLVLRRFAARIATNKRHDEFLIAYHEQLKRNHENKCASTIQLAYRCYKFRLQLKQMLAKMFIEFTDHTGRAVKFQHISSGKILPKRPIFLKGVVCGKVVPLPFPGEEFRAFCERHEDSTNPKAASVPAEVYCVECEDAMCQICFDRDHSKRDAFKQHQSRRIQKCYHCNTETATRECLQCGNGKVPFCDVCYPHVHKQPTAVSKQDSTKGSGQIPGPAESPDRPADPGSMRQHRFQALVVMCVECSSRVAQWACETCLDAFCKRCMSSCHAKGQRQYHHCHRLSYFSVLRQKAEQKRDTDAQKDRERRRKQREEEKKRQEAERLLQNLSATKIQALIRGFVARRSGKAYMRLVRQTQAARAQRLKDEKVRSSITYKVKAVFGVSPSLKSDTKQEAAARKQRFEDIKSALLLQWRSSDGLSAPQKKRWTKRKRAQAVAASRTWCCYDMQVKIRKGEWKGCVGSIVSTQNLLLTGTVLVFILLANRSVVVNWEHIEPYDEDEILRQPYRPPQEVAIDLSRDFHAKISQVLERGARRARLLYLQTIEFQDIMQYAWVVEYDKLEKKEQFWNVVLNKRVVEPPKAMQLIERMEPEEREKLEKRVELAKSKLVALLNPFQPKDKPKLALRRNAIVFVSARNFAAEEDSPYSALLQELEAIEGARFWQDKIMPSPQFGGKKARKFLAASPAQACWPVVKVLQWMDLHQTGGFEPHAKVLMKLSDELQTYVVSEVGKRLEDGSNDIKEARDKLLQLLKLKEETLQLLVTKEQRDAEEEEGRQA